MPAVSQAQRAYLAMKFGPAWMAKHHFDNPGPLPHHVGSAHNSITRATKRGKQNPKRHTRKSQHAIRKANDGGITMTAEQERAMKMIAKRR